jgi:hypothetical protein
MFRKHARTRTLFWATHRLFSGQSSFWDDVATNATIALGASRQLGGENVMCINWHRQLGKLFAIRIIPSAVTPCALEASNGPLAFAALAFGHAVHFRARRK